MSIERWEMLLSSRADRYILKIRGAKADVDKIVASNPRVCQDAQEISDAVFQWVIFVVDANQAERLAIQNQLIAMTSDPAVGPQASFDLSEMLTGLSDALENLTNLTAEEQAFVAKKMKQVQERDAALPPVAPRPAAVPPVKPVAPLKGPAPVVAPKTPSSPNGVPTPPAVHPPAAPAPTNKPAVPVPPLAPRVPVAGPPPAAPAAPKGPPMGGTPAAPRPPTPPPAKPIPEIPVEPMIDHGFAPVGGPAPVPPPAPPKATPPAPPPAAPVKPVVPVDVPIMPGEIVLDIGIDEALPLPVPEPKPSPPRNDLTAVLKAPPPGKPVPEKPLGAGIEPLSTTPTPVEAGRTPPPAPVPPVVPTPPAVPPPAPIPAISVPPPTSPAAPPATPPPSAPVVPPAPAAVPAPPAAPAAPVREPKLVVELKTPEDSTFKTAIFFPQGGDAPKQKFLNTITDMAQKKSKKPMFFHIVHSQATSITSDNAVEWIWTAKAQGADCFFVILPPDILPDFMEGIVAEARQAGLRCFLIPQAEIGSKLLYMDLMVELMLIKRKPKTNP